MRELIRRGGRSRREQGRKARLSWRRLLLLVLCCAGCAMTAWGTGEAALEALADRFEVLPLSEGWALRSLDAAADFRVVEVRPGAIAIDGQAQLPSEIADRLGTDASHLLELAGLAPLEPVVELESTAADTADTTDEVATEELPAQPAESAILVTPAPVEPVEPAADESADTYRRPERRQRSDTRQTFGRPLQIDEYESVAEALVVGSYLEVDGEVRGSATVVGGSARVDGEVGDDLVVVGGSVELGPDSEINGDVVAVGGSIDRSSGSRVRGEISELAFGSVFPRSWQRDWERPWRRHWGRSAFSGIVLPILQAVLIALVLLIVLQVGRPWVEGVAQRTRREPLKAGLAGLLTQLLFVPLMAVVSFVLAITIIGIPILVALWLVVAVVTVVVVVVGYTGVALTSGGLLERRFALGGTSLYVTLLLGVVLIHGWEVVGRVLSFADGPLGWSAFLLVVVGGVIQYAAVTIGLGGVMLERFDSPDTNATPPPVELPPAWPPDDEDDGGGSEGIAEDGLAENDTGGENLGDENGAVDERPA